MICFATPIWRYTGDLELNTIKIQTHCLNFRLDSCFDCSAFFSLFFHLSVILPRLRKDHIVQLLVLCKTWCTKCIKNTFHLIIEVSYEAFTDQISRLHSLAYFNFLTFVAMSRQNKTAFNPSYILTGTRFFKFYLILTYISSLAILLSGLVQILYIFYPRLITILQEGYFQQHSDLDVLYTSFSY